MPITEPFWDDPNTDGPYDWENFEDYLDESHNSYMSENMNMKHGYSVINEIKLALPAMAQVMGCQEQDLFILNYVFCRHMYNNEAKDHAKASYGIDGLRIQYDVPLHKGNNSVFFGFTLFECRGLDKKYIIFSTPSVSGERFYCTVMKKGDVFAIKRHFQKQQRKTNKQNPPILQDNLVDDVVTNSIGFLLNKKKIEKYNVRIRRGILLSGDPGNGKTMLCRWIQRLCDEKDITWGVVTASEIERTFSEGHGLDSLFNSYQVTFFDDIDIGYLKRDAGKGEIACAILSAMDGINQSEHVVRIFTTNETIDKMDPAFIRPGRIDRCFNIGRPTPEQRRKLIIERWDKEILEYLMQSNNLDHLINITKDFSFAELEAIKTILVTNKLMKTKKWDLKDAIEDFYQSRDSWAPNKTVSFGFSGSPKGNW
jgi:cell division protease FtsH